MNSVLAGLGASVSNTILFRVLGPVEADRDGERLELGRRRERCLLALLLLEAGTVVPVDRLLDLLWDGDPVSNARANLHSHVSRLRGRLAGDGVRLLARDGGYVAAVDQRAVDAHRFRTLVAIGGAVSDPAHRSALLRRALALWRGPPLADVATDRLRDRVAGDLTELRLVAIETAVDAALALGRHAELLGELFALTAEHPLRQRPAGHLMLALYRAGRQPEALAVYHDLRVRLAQDLGVDPTPELRNRYEAILRHDPELGSGPRSRPAVPTQLPFATAQFTGRAAALDALDGAAAVTVIHGGPGVGKTALAVNWAHRVAGRFPDGQLFADLRGHARQPPRPPAEVLAQFLTALDVPPERVPSSVAELSALYRTSLTGKKVLIVLDNAATAAQVRPLLPGSDGCLTLITSRDNLAGLVATHDAHPIRLDVLTGADAERLLTGVVPDATVAGNPAAVSELAQMCGRLPLALRIAAALMTMHDESVADMVDRLRDCLGTTQIAGDPRAAVRAAVELSCRGLDPAAGRLFRRLSLAPGRDVTVPVAATLLDLPAEEAGPVLDRLVLTQLVQEHRPRPVPRARSDPGPCGRTVRGRGDRGGTAGRHATNARLVPTHCVRG